MFTFGFLKNYFPKYLSGVELTLIISIVTVFMGVILGSLLFFMKSSEFKIWKIKPLKIIASIYVEVVRGTPMLLQILMVYSGTKLIFNIDVDAITASILAIGLNSAAYVAEIIRAGIEGVDKGQSEAARSLGMSKVMTMRLIIMPQAIRNILPAIGNEFVTVIKESSMASVLGVGELTYSAKIVQGATYLSLEPLMVAAVFYFILTFSLGRLMSYLERRMKTSD
ncbi:MAG: amino acid ABC transporter permease [Clostridium sp.]|uniref:amino acid ABC transporter permease n=1 Tax=Clostridium sp. DSM 8431 TaxID=1761781 RepID=UPI0008EB6FBF|nr:amino acid ABC transporter permease [Clostridium sp. DSM 8431]MCR4943938.1 amino acid ABC transporter permease [Clostridium sp.]SFU82000.1 amino acid ABC transporter membrane protein, PAAT family [Clostridium sp. DSM 8431]